MKWIHPWFSVAGMSWRIKEGTWIRWYYHCPPVNSITFIVMSCVLGTELSDFPLDRPAALNVRVRHKVSSVVKVRVRFKM
jgi:hypothetical protein